MPLVTLPCRLQNGLPLFPPPERILDYLESIAPRIMSSRTLQFLRHARCCLSVVEEALGAAAEAAAEADADAANDVKATGADAAAAEKGNEADPTAPASPEEESVSGAVIARPPAAVASASGVRPAIA